MDRTESPASSRPAFSDPGPGPMTLSAWTQLVQEDLLHVDPTAENLRPPPCPTCSSTTHSTTSEHRNTDRPRDGRVLRVTAGFRAILVPAADGEAAAVSSKRGELPIEDLRAASVVHDVPVIVVGDDADWRTTDRDWREQRSRVAAVDSVSGRAPGRSVRLRQRRASMTNGAASIVDPSGPHPRILHGAGPPIDDLRRETTLTLQERTLPALDADFKVVYSSIAALFVAPHGDRGGRLALAVRAGGELLGSIWIIDPGGERRQTALDALDRLAPLAGLHMLHARSASDFTERRNADLMRTLIDDPDTSLFAAAQLGLIDYTDGSPLRRSPSPTPNPAASTPSANNIATDSS